MGNRALAVLGGVLLVIFPLAGVAILLWVFRDNLGSLTLEVHDDRRLARTSKALKRSLHSDVDAYHALAVSVRAREARRKEPPATARARLAASTLFAVAVWDKMGQKARSAASIARLCIAYFGRERRPAPERVPVVVQTDNWIESSQF